MTDLETLLPLKYWTGRRDNRKEERKDGPFSEISFLPPGSCILRLASELLENFNCDGCCEFLTASPTCLPDLTSLFSGNYREQESKMPLAVNSSAATTEFAAQQFVVMGTFDETVREQRLFETLFINEPGREISSEAAQYCCSS